LQKSFSVTEEWGYQDRTTQEHRTLDIFAYRKLPEENRAGLLIALALVLLVECKRSQNPYMCFSRARLNVGGPSWIFPESLDSSGLSFTRARSHRRFLRAAALVLRASTS
jgi:hypothetical protein